MSWGLLAETVSRNEAPAPARRRSLAQIVDTHISWQGTGTGPAQAMSLPALFAVVRLIASTIDQLPIAGAPDWLARPRRYGSALDQGDLIQHTVTAMALHGRAFWLARRVGESWRLDAVHNGSVGVAASDFGVVDMTFTFNGEPIRRVPAVAEEWAAGPYLLHIPYLVTPDSPAGTSPVAAAWPALAGYLAVERQAANLLDGGTWSGGRLETDTDITADTAKRWQEAWVANRASGKIPVLGAGLRYESDIVEPRAASWIESRTYNAQVVASMYGVPTDLLGMSMAGGQSSLSYANSQDNNRRFRTNCLEAFTGQIADAISTLLPPGRSTAEAATVTFDYTDWEGGTADADTADAGPADA